MQATPLQAHLLTDVWSCLIRYIFYRAAVSRAAAYLSLCCVLCITCQCFWAGVCCHLTAHVGTTGAMCATLTCRCLDTAAAAAHIGALHKAYVNITHLEALAAPDCQACDGPLRHRLSALTATLLRSVHQQLMTSLCSSIVQAGALPHSASRIRCHAYPVPVMCGQGKPVKK